MQVFWRFDLLPGYQHEEWLVIVDHNNLAQQPSGQRIHGCPQGRNVLDLPSRKGGDRQPGGDLDHQNLQTMLGKYPLLDGDINGKPCHVFIGVSDPDADELSLRAGKSSPQANYRKENYRNSHVSFHEALWPSDPRYQQRCRRARGTGPTESVGLRQLFQLTSIG